MCWQRWDSFCWPAHRCLASKPATIHLIREAFALADADVQEALSEPLRRLREIFGGAVRESSLQELVADDAGHSFATWADTFCVIQWAEIESCLGAWIANARPEFGPEIAASFQLMNATRPATRRGGSATTRTIFSKFARVSRTGRSAVHPNNTRARSSQGRSTQTQFEWKRLLSSHIIADERCRDGPPAASVAPNSRRRRRTSRACRYSRGMDRTHSCCKWRRMLIEKQVCVERLVDGPVIAAFRTVHPRA